MELRRILVVDDNTVNLAAVEKSLKSKYEVIPMISGRRALKFLYCQRVDLILLDVEMPEMSGVETLEEIRKLDSTADTPVIFLTAKKDKQTVLDGFRLKIMDYITKPFEADDLAQRVDFTLKRAGIIPFEKKEMYGVIGNILSKFESGDSTQGINKLIEATNYKTEEEIIGRIKFALEKINNGDAAGAINVLHRIYKMIQVETGVTDDEAEQMTQAEIKNRVKEIVDDLDSFKTKDAIAKCKELLKCKLPKFIADLINKSLEFLNNYDDEEAEKLLKKLLEQIGGN